MRRPYVAVDEARRALFRDASLKSMDFIVYSQQTHNLLIDVKGRRFPEGSRSWQNWAMKDDIDSLLEWEQVFGEGFRSVLVFAYEVRNALEMDAHDITWDFRGRRYAFYGIWTSEYAANMKTRSQSWQTVSVPMKAFANLKRPLLELI